MSEIKHKRRSQRGQSMVEGVLILLTVIGIILGVMDFGQMMYLHQTLTERARAAARYGSMNPTDTQHIKNLVVFGRLHNHTDAIYGSWGLTYNNVQVLRNNVNTNEDEVVVRVVNYPVRILSFWIAGKVIGRTIVASSPVEVVT